MIKFLLSRHFKFILKIYTVVFALMFFFVLYGEPRYGPTDYDKLVTIVGLIYVFLLALRFIAWTRLLGEKAYSNIMGQDTDVVKAVKRDKYLEQQSKEKMATVAKNATDVTYIPKKILKSMNPTKEEINKAYERLKHKGLVK